MEKKIVAKDKNTANFRRLKEYLKLNDVKPDIQDNRGLRKPAQ
jgi:hypothetical protein